MQYNKQMYVWKIVLQYFNIKYEKSNSNINISNIVHLPFDMLCYLLESTMSQCRIHWQLAGTLKWPVVQNCVPGTTK